MANDKNKVVQNYCLEQMKQVYPNQSNFFFKKLKSGVYATKFSKNYLPQKGSNIEQAQTQMNKKSNVFLTCLWINTRGWSAKVDNHRCSKPFETAKCLVRAQVLQNDQNYQQFLPSLLIVPIVNSTATTFEPTTKFPSEYNYSNSGNQLLENLTKAVIQTHNNGFLILGLNLNNIYVRDKFEVFFGDWTLSKKVGSGQKITLTKAELNSQFIGNQVKEEGIFGFWSDVYSLGKVFKAVENCCLLQPMSSTRKKIQTIINKMVSANYKQRPSIKQILSAFGNRIYQQQNSPTNSHSLKQQIQDTKFKSNLQIKQVKNLEETTMEQMNQSQMQVNLLCSQKKWSPEKKHHFIAIVSPKSGTAKTIPNTELSQYSLLHYRKKSSVIPLKDDALLVSHTSANRLSRNSRRSWQGNEQVFKNINKKRNLVIVLIDLAEFVLRTELSPQLGFMLLKYSLLVSKQNLQKQKSQKNDSKALSEILEKQLSGIQQIIASLTQQLKQLAKQVASLKRQIELSNLINDKYMKEKIIQFAKEIVLSCQKNKAQKLFSAKLIDILFKTYLILKKVEQGSYQKFWQRAANQDYIYLSNQKYLKDEKSLGLRYLKSRIAQVISKAK